MSIFSIAIFSGKDDQGMSTALQVEKVKREGRIIHENDASKNFIIFKFLFLLIFLFLEDEPTITEILKNPTKVVLLKVHT